MDLSEGMPRSTLDGIHGDDPNYYVVWKPAFPGDLPQYWMHDYKPVGPENPNTWVRRGRRITCRARRTRQGSAGPPPTL
ncbi:MAG: hypothetical protein JWR32_1943 [Mycobacterium sp.]|nr:hypothetical protein [Mycobacterium sp.]